ncbi:MAG: hypothetical protein K2W95_32720 [Candidatus Obscuribacterales bacterium]|nr:hypothetical protein [Candidatus Obscuribacterales bacterium]
MTARRGIEIVEQLLSVMTNPDVTLFELADALRAGELCGDVSQMDCEEAILLIRQQLRLQQLREESMISENLAMRVGDFADILEHQIKPKTVPITPCCELMNKILASVEEIPEVEATQFASEIHSGKAFSEVPKLLLEELILEIRANARAAKLGNNSTIPGPKLPIMCQIADLIEHRINESTPNRQDDDFDTKYDFYQNLAAENNLTNSTWSIYDVTDFKLVPFPNSTKLVYAEHSGNVPVEIKLRRGSTWLDLWTAADKAIKESGDSHHTFIEAFEEDGEALVLVTGS